MRFFTVVDESHSEASTSLQMATKLLDEAITKYISILKDVSTEVTKKGMTTDRYEEYQQLISKVDKTFGVMSETMGDQLDYYLEDIDDADSYLYIYS